MSSARQVGEGGIATASALSDVLGATTDAKVATDTTGTISGKLRGVVALLVDVADRLVDSGFSAANLLTTIAGRLIGTGETPASVGLSAANIDGKITACNTGAVAGSVTANAGTNLNTSALATEAGNLATLLGRVAAVRRQCTGTPTLVNQSGTTAVSAQLAVGDYYVKAQTSCYIKQGASTVTATTSHFWLPAGAEIIVTVSNATNNGYIANITDGASVTNGLRIEPVEAA